MANVSWQDRKRIKRTIRDAYTPSMWYKFPITIAENSSEVRCKSIPDCPPGVERILLGIQCALLPFFFTAEFYVFCRINKHGDSLGQWAKHYHMHHQELYSMIDRMLNKAVNKMTNGEAESAKSVYWEMHKDDDFEIVAISSKISQS